MATNKKAAAATTPHAAIKAVRVALADKLPKESATGVLVIATDGDQDIRDICFGTVTAERIANAIVSGAALHSRYRDLLTEILGRVQALPESVAPTAPHSNHKLFVYVEALVQNGYPIDDLLGALMAVAAKYAKQPAVGKCAGGVQQCRSCFLDTADEAYGGHEHTVEPHGVN